MKAGKYNLKYSTLKRMYAATGGTAGVVFALNRRWRMENLSERLEAIGRNKAARDIKNQLVQTSLLARVLDALCEGENAKGI